MKYALTILLLTLYCLSCKRHDDNKPGPAYNGFKIDGVVYSMDTMERDFYATTGALRIRSKDNGGGMIYLRRGWVTWPSADGVYNYSIRASASDTNEVKVCFEPDSLFESYCSMTGGSAVSTTLTLTISGGKWALSLPPTQIIDHSIKTLEISAGE